MDYVYILKCSDGSLYTGWTNDIEKRLLAHSEGRGARYTRAHLPVELMHLEELPDKQSAMKREWQIKHMTRSAKLELIAGGDLMADRS